MTTAVTVTTADHAASVQAVVKPRNRGLLNPPQVVPPHSQYVFYVHSSQDLHITEVEDDCKG